MRKICPILIAVVIVHLTYSLALAWDNKATHKDISEIASNKSIIGTTDRLKYIGLENGLLQLLKLGTAKQELYKWLRQGADLEDAGSNWDFVKGTARSYNHFHNPLNSKPWETAGLNDEYSVASPLPPYYIYKSMHGESALLWAQDQANQQSYSESKGLEGDQAWQTIRNYYYNALTGKIDLERQGYFARVFKGLGHQMHLIQDMAVPAHVRNDAHVEETIQDMGIQAGIPQIGDLYFEIYAKSRADMVVALASNPVFPQVDLTKNPGGKIATSQFYDTNQYAENTVPSTSLSWGLAEYANANFVSRDTVFTEMFSESDKHYFPYPRYINYSQCYEQYEETLYPSDAPRTYWRKKCGGEPVDHFVKVGALFNYLPTWELQRLSLNLDERTHYDYASKLLPRAVGYSAGLLNYFFRGDIRLEYVSSPNPGYVIRNNTNEDINGLFQIFYDKKVIEADKSQDVRVEYGQGTFGIKANSSSSVFDISPPDKAREPGTYVLVFKGQMGKELDAVAGYVYRGSGLEITPPSGFVYGIIDGGEEPQQFVRLKAKIRNTSSGEIRGGTLQATASYRKRADYASDLSVEPPYFQNRAKEVSVSISVPQEITGLSATEAKEYLFDFTAEPIPAGVTDLYLDVVYRGQTGSSQAMAVGRKDINEPHHLVLYNLTDRYAVQHVLYTAQEILADSNLLAFINELDGPDFYPHPQSMALYFSKTNGKYPTAPAAAIKDMPEAGYGRVIFLVDEPDTFYLRNILMDDAGAWQYNSALSGVVDQLDGDIWKNIGTVQFRGVRAHSYYGYFGCVSFPAGNCGEHTGSWPVVEDLTPYPVLINAQ